MRLRVVRSICLPRQAMTERGFFYCVGCKAIALGVPICASLSRNGPELSRLLAGIYLRPEHQKFDSTSSVAEHLKINSVSPLYPVGRGLG
jgi:hypothetical protein